MSLTFGNSKQRPFSADVSRLTKVRLQSSNCPTILKHEVTSPTDNFQPFASNTGSEKNFMLNRPMTANNVTKMKFSFLQSSVRLTSPVSTSSARPISGAMNSTINFDFINNIGKAPTGKFQDKSKIKPLKKLKIDQFHNVIYKVKQQKEVLEKEINRMEQWQKDVKENDIWNTPQTAIIDSIMKMNAKSNPEGNVGRYLQNEKEKDDFMRQTKRPSSSYSTLPKRTPTHARSVQDFFSPDNNEEIIEEILGSSKKLYSNKYDKAKQKITEKINSFVENLDNCSALMNNTKDHFTPTGSARDSNKGYYQASKYSEGGLRQSKEMLYGHSVGIEDPQIRSISEIVESYEGSEMSPVHGAKKAEETYQQPQQYGSTPGKFRPYSAKVQINTAFSPKDFNQVVVEVPHHSSASPAPIHARPQTAKQMRVSTSGTLSSGLLAMGESKQSIGNVKFVPMSLEGQKMTVEPLNFGFNKWPSSKTMSTASMSRSTKNMHQNSSFKNIPGIIQQETDRVVFSNKMNKIAPRRLMSAKPLVKSTSGTQTADLQADSHGAVGKVNIDGEYFQNYMNHGGESNSSSGMSTMKGFFRTSSGQKKTRDNVESWAAKENNPHVQVVVHHVRDY